MKPLKAFVRMGQTEGVIRALEQARAPGITVSRVHGVGYGYDPCLFTLAPGELRKAPKVSKVEVVCQDDDAERLLEAIIGAAHTGCRGDGIVFVTPVERGQNPHARGRRPSLPQPLKRLNPLLRDSWPVTRTPGCGNEGRQMNQIEVGRAEGPPPASSGTANRSSRVRRLYRIGAARWYDPFRALWTWLTSRGAEAAFDRLLRARAPEGSRVLDIGCGTGHNLGRLRRLGVAFGSYRGVDLTDAMLAIARRRYADESRASFVESDVYSLADAPERYDVILCTWVISHLERPRDAFEIAHRLLAPEGHALFLTLTRPRWYVSWWFAPLVRLFQARYVEASALRHLPGVTAIQTWTAGLVTLVHLQKATSASSGSGEPV